MYVAKSGRLNANLNELPLESEVGWRGSRVQIFKEIFSYFFSQACITFITKMFVFF